MNKKVTAFTLLILSALLCPCLIFAVEQRGGASSEVSLALVPFSSQTVSFASESFKDTTSNYGIAGRFAYFYNIDDILSVGAVLSPGYHTFHKDYYNFTNIQLDARVRIALYRTPDRFFSFLISGGAGTDFAIRSDGLSSFYLLASCGAEMDFRLSDVSVITAGCDFGWSYHPESTYRQIAPFIGYKRLF